MESMQGAGNGEGSGESEIDTEHRARVAAASDAAADDANRRVAPMLRTQLVERAEAFRLKRTVERVELPWLGSGSHTFVRGMTSGERDDFEASLLDTNDKVSSKNIRAKFLIRVLCDADGTRLFADHEDTLLAGLDAKTADALYDRGRTLSGVTKADLEDMQKNSDRARSAAISFNSALRSSAVSPTS